MKTLTTLLSIGPLAVLWGLSGCAATPASEESEARSQSENPGIEKPRDVRRLPPGALLAGVRAAVLHDEQA